VRRRRASVAAISTFGIKESGTGYVRSENGAFGAFGGVVGSGGA
jgi:hypothetical protein